MAVLAEHNILIGDCKGSGTFGTFYSGTNMTTGEQVGIKEISMLKQSEAQTTWETFALKLFSGLPNFLKFYQFIKGSNGFAYLVTELADMDLGFLHYLVGAFPLAIVAYFGKQVSLLQLIR